MLGLTLNYLICGVKRLWEVSSCFQRISLSTIGGVFSLWLLWRLWTFTVVPYFRPREPREYPYWIPVFGHTGSFFQNSHKLVADAISYFQKSRDPFTITIAGARYHVLSLPSHSNEFFSNISTFTWDGFLYDVLIGFGVNKNGVDVLWKQLPPTPVNPSGKCLIHLTQDLYKQYLLPGPQFGALIEKYKEALNRLTAWEQFACHYGLATYSETQPISLYDLCANIMIDAIQLTLFDPILQNIDPTMTQDMRRFTDDLWKLLHPSPFVDSKDVQAILKRYSSAFLRYRRLPKEMRAAEAAVVTSLIDQYRELGINEEDSAAMLVMVYWAGDANAYKLAFWIMAYILFDQELHTAIRNETAAAVQAKEIDMAYLLNHCPLLKSVYHETLRITKKDPAFRRIERDIEIGGKLLRKGDLAMLSVSQLHENGAVFGCDTSEFVPDRFLKRPDLATNASYRPFGSGKTYCPGRFFAMQETLAFVAVLIHRLDIQLTAGSPSFPTANESMLTLGVSRPVSGSDVLVTLFNGPPRRGERQIGPE